MLVGGVLLPAFLQIVFLDQLFQLTVVLASKGRFPERAIQERSTQRCELNSNNSCTHP